MQSGIQFFPLDTNTDSKLALIECEFGLKGFAVIVKLWQKIYGGEGYYLRWDRDVALLFAREVGLGYEAVSEIINAAIRRDIFSADLAARYGVLTSSGIQKRYLEAVKRRKEVVLKKELLLVRVEQIPQNVHILEENVYNNDQNVYSFNQIKKEINKKDDDGDAPIRVYISLFGEVTDLVRTDLTDFGRKLPLPVIKHILELAKTDGKKWNWTKTVLKNAVRDSITSVTEFENAREQHNIKRKATTKKNNFTNYTQTGTYDFDDIEKRALEKRLAQQGGDVQ